MNMDGQPAEHTHDGHPWVEPWGKYITVQWQDGTVREHGENGALVSDMLACVVARLCALQEHRPCPENRATLVALGDALEWQAARDAVGATAARGSKGIGWEEV